MHGSVHPTTSSGFVGFHTLEYKTPIAIPNMILMRVEMTRLQERWGCTLFPSIMYPFFQTILSIDTFHCLLQILRANDHLRPTIVRTEQTTDFYYLVLRTTLEILDGLLVTYQRRTQPWLVMRCGLFHGSVFLGFIRTSWYVQSFSDECWMGLFFMNIEWVFFGWMLVYRYVHYFDKCWIGTCMILIKMEWNCHVHYFCLL